MKRSYRSIIIAVIILLAAGGAGGVVMRKRGIPFVGQKEQWTIGIYRGKTPFQLDSPLNLLNPVLKAEHVTDVPAKFVADPFLVKEGKTWYLFFEVYNNETRQGDLALATSTNTVWWQYEQVILDEPFHLSYPYVFEWEGEYYLIPESFEDQSIRLYRAEEFPTRWSLVARLVEGIEHVDNSVIHYNGRWWLFACTINNDTLHLYSADELTGPWVEHPASPIVRADNHKARPSGRMIVYEGRLYRFTMDVEPESGSHQVMAYEIIEITPSTYSERLLQEMPVLKASGSGWNAQAMHQLDPVEIGPGNWIASVDGFGPYTVFGWEY